MAYPPDLLVLIHEYVASPSTRIDPYTSVTYLYRETFWLLPYWPWEQIWTKEHIPTWNCLEIFEIIRKNQWPLLLRYDAFFYHGVPTPWIPKWPQMWQTYQHHLDETQIQWLIDRLVINVNNILDLTRFLCLTEFLDLLDVLLMRYPTYMNSATTISYLEHNILTPKVYEWYHKNYICIGVIGDIIFKTYPTLKHETTCMECRKAKMEWYAPLSSLSSQSTTMVLSQKHTTNHNNKWIGLGLLLGGGLLGGLLWPTLSRSILT